MDDISIYHGKRRRNGWYLQQLLKLYASFVIPDILDRYLVVDSDTFFKNPTTFVENGKCLYNPGTEYYEQYFIHMNKLHPSLKKVHKDMSGISHHMMFEKKYIIELFELVEQTHGEKFWQVFLGKVIDYDGSGASEYEIYFNYMLIYHEKDIKIRYLKWKNSDNIDDIENYDYISCHWYMRK